MKEGKRNSPYIQATEDDLLHVDVYHIEKVLLQLTSSENMSASSLAALLLAQWTNFNVTGTSMRV